ncbi:unnamed protein product, partial [Closterium sp. NIES-54]
IPLYHLSFSHTPSPILSPACTPPLQYTTLLRRFTSPLFSPMPTATHSLFTDSSQPIHHAFSSLPYPRLPHTPYTTSPDPGQEICMGLLANLACHVAPAHSMTAMGMGGSDSAAPSSMMHAVVGVLMGEDDPPCLTETCRLLGTVLRGAESEPWAAFLAGSAADCLPRVLWIAANTLHPQLLRKCTDLLLAMVDSSHPASRVLLPALLALPLLSTLADLIASEMDRLADGSRDE